MPEAKEAPSKVVKKKCPICGTKGVEEAQCKCGHFMRPSD